MGTLADYYASANGDGRVKKLNGDFDAATTVAENARTAARQAQADFDQASQGVDKLAARIGIVQRLLPTAPTRPDGDELLDELDFLTGELAAAQRAQLKADGVRQLAAVRAEIAALIANRLAAALAAAKAASKEAKTLADSRAELKIQIESVPLKDVRGKAVLLGVANAEKRVGTAAVDGDFPKELVAQSLKLRTTAVKARKDAADAAETARSEYLTATTDELGASGSAAVKREQRDRADAALRRYAATAEAELKRITATLERIADEDIEPLTEAESEELSDTALKVKRLAALAAELTFVAGTEAAALAAAKAKLEQAKTDLANAPGGAPNLPALQTAVADATTALNAATAKADKANEQFVGLRAALLEKRDARDVAFKAWTEARAKAVSSGIPAPDDDPAVKAAKLVQDAAIAAYRTAMAKEKDSHGGILRAWRAAAPVSAWRRLFDLADLDDALKALKGIDPAQLTGDAAAADVALAAAVKAADDAADDIAAKQDARTLANAVAAVTATDGQDRPNP